MYITKIESTKGKRYKVFGNEEFLFALYFKELKNYGINECIEVEDSIINKIKDELIFKRAKERALYLLERKAFSVSMMQDKLYNNDYPEEIVEQVISFLKEYRYLDDTAYVQMYINTYSNKKSRKQITYDLWKKGIDKSVIEAYFESFSYSEDACFQRQFEKYIKGKDLNDWRIRQKIFRYFYGKGFSTSTIEKYLMKTCEKM